MTDEAPMATVRDTVRPTTAWHALNKDEKRISPGTNANKMIEQLPRGTKPSTPNWMPNYDEV